jgi:hypothetical protein
MATFRIARYVASLSAVERSAGMSMWAGIDFARRIVAPDESAPSIGRHAQWLRRPEMTEQASDVS